LHHSHPFPALPPALFVHIPSVRVTTCWPPTSLSCPVPAVLLRAGLVASYPLSPWAHSVFWVSFHSYAIILTADLGLLQTLAFYSAWDYANFALLQCLLLMSMWCHLATMLTDPGGEFHHHG